MTLTLNDRGRLARVGDGADFFLFVLVVRGQRVNDFGAAGRNRETLPAAAIFDGLGSTRSSRQPAAGVAFTSIRPPVKISFNASRRYSRPAAGFRVPWPYWSSTAPRYRIRARPSRTITSGVRSNRRHVREDIAFVFEHRERQPVLLRVRREPDGALARV